MLDPTIPDEAYRLWAASQLSSLEPVCPVHPVMPVIDTWVRFQQAFGTVHKDYKNGAIFAGWTIQLVDIAPEVEDIEGYKERNTFEIQYFVSAHWGRVVPDQEPFPRTLGSSEIEAVRMIRQAARILSEIFPPGIPRLNAIGTPRVADRIDYQTWPGPNFAHVGTLTQEVDINVIRPTQDIPFSGLS